LSTRSASARRPRGTCTDHAAVAEVAPDLAQHRRHGVAGERDVAAEVEAIDRLEEAQAGDLNEIVKGFPGALVAARQPAREGQEALRKHVAIRRVAPLQIALQQRPVGAQAPRVTSSLAHREAQLYLAGPALRGRQRRGRRFGTTCSPGSDSARR
jgi:hypothetical protein